MKFLLIILITSLLSNSVLADYSKLNCLELQTAQKEKQEKLNLLEGEQSNLKEELKSFELASAAYKKETNKQKLKTVAYLGLGIVSLVAGIVMSCSIKNKVYESGVSVIRGWSILPGLAGLIGFTAGEIAALENAAPWGPSAKAENFEDTYNKSIYQTKKLGMSTIKELEKSIVSNRSEIQEIEEYIAIQCH